MSASDMALLRARRRAAGLVERTAWVPKHRLAEFERLVRQMGGDAAGAVARRSKRCRGPNGQRYDSAREASDATGVALATMQRWCRLERNGWRYV